jgi:hypothetical protein
MIQTFIEDAHAELDERWTRWELDLAHSEVHEVIGALIARQVTLAVQLAACPTMWNGHMAPIILRSMADVYISLAWVLRDPVDRARKFVLHGLGQAKLFLEHQKAALASKEVQPEDHLLVEASEQWINAQQFTFLTEVNFGSWSGITTRQMADEADCLDFYNYVYTPFSAASHSMWHHIGRYNLKTCTNPLHRYHNVPHIPDLGPDPHYLYLAAKYMQKAFSAFDAHTNIDTQSPSAFARLCETLAQWANDGASVEQGRDKDECGT